MSKYFNKSALKAISRMGDIMIPRSEEFPSFSDTGCIEHIDDFLAYSPESDLKDLNMILSLISLFPDAMLGWLINKMSASHKNNGGLSSLFRQLDFGMRGIIFSCYYSNKTGKGFKGKKPFEVIDYQLNRVIS